MELSRQDVERVALLARLRFSSDEIVALARQLGQVVTYVESLGQLNTDDVAPMVHAVDIHGALRDDEPRPSLTRDLALSNAPQADGECFLVPAVLGSVTR